MRQAAEMRENNSSNHGGVDITGAPQSLKQGSNIEEAPTFSKGVVVEDGADGAAARSATSTHLHREASQHLCLRRPWLQLLLRQLRLRQRLWFGRW